MCCRYYVESSERTHELVEQMPPSLQSRWELTDAMKTSGEIKLDSVPEDMIGNAITDLFFEKYKEGIEPVEQLSFL